MAKPRRKNIPNPRPRQNNTLSAEDEPDIELEAFEEPLDPLFPRFPNAVSRRGHRAIKIIALVEGNEVIPPTARSVKVVAEINTYGPQRIGRNMHVFRHRLRWGLMQVTLPLEPGHHPPYTFPVIVERQLGDDHIGEGPYEALVGVTPSSATGKANDADIDDDLDPRVAISFIGV